MQTQGLRIILYSSIPLLLLASLWGIKQIPEINQSRLSLSRQSLDQELTVVRGAAQTAIEAQTLRLIDVLKTDGHPLEGTAFTAVTLLQFEQNEWKSPWTAVKPKSELTLDFKTWMRNWPLGKIAPGDSYFSKVADVGGQAYFALLTQVVGKAGAAPMIAVGIFPATQFGLALPTSDSREYRVFTDKGMALALGHPAYLGAALKHDPLVEEILNGEQPRILREWKNETGGHVIGTAARLSESNLFVGVETTSPKNLPYVAYIYLALSTLGGLSLNWVLFKSLLMPLLDQLTEAETDLELMRRKLEARPEREKEDEIALPTPALKPLIPVAPKVEEDAPPPFFQAKLGGYAFVEDAKAPVVVPEIKAEPVIPEVKPAPKPHSNLEKVLRTCLRAFDSRLKAAKTTVKLEDVSDLEVDADPLQLQTAFEEILKNSIEAMEKSEVRQITISGRHEDGHSHLEIRDTGSGVLDEHLASIFDPFFTTKRSDGPARGLGLNVVRRIAEDLHGHVRISNYEDGALFTLDWPDKHVEPKRHEILEDEIDLDEFSFVPTVTPTLPEINIRKPRVRTLD